MNYRDLLDLRNQKLVDKVYAHVKDRDDEQIDEAYQQISEKNNTQYKTTLKQINLYLDKASQIAGIIGMIIFAILFIVCGSFILAFFFMYLNVILIDSMQGLYNWIYGFGMKVYDFLFAKAIGITALQYLGGKTDLSTTTGFYILGFATLLIFFFSTIFILSFFKKVEPKKIQEKLSLKDSYHYLQVDENDSFSYIRFRFQKKFKRRHRDYFERYFQAYIQIFDHYQEVQGTFQDLTTIQKVKIIFFTMINTIKNVLGSFSKPLFASIVFIIIYWQNFTYTNLFTLELFLKALPFGHFMLAVLNQSYSIVSHTFFKGILLYFNLEFAKLLSFCICLTFVCFLYSVITKKVLESLRQYHRRKNYYLKINQGLLEENHVYHKCYRYSVSFLVFVVMVSSAMGAYYLNETQSPLLLMNAKDREEVVMNMEIRDRIKIKLNDYALKNRQLSTVWGNLYADDYVQKDTLNQLALPNNPYLITYTCYHEKDANKLVKSLKGLKIKKTETFSYGVNEKGFVIKDHNIVIVMANKEKIGGLTALLKPLSVDEEKEFMAYLGYKVS